MNNVRGWPKEEWDWYRQCWQTAREIISRRMETKMGKKKKRNRSHSDEFKREAVGLLESRGERTAAAVAASLGVQPGQLYQWKKEFGVQSRPTGMESVEEENRRLRLQNS